MSARTITGAPRARVVRFATLLALGLVLAGIAPAAAQRAEVPADRSLPPVSVLEVSLLGLDDEEAANARLAMTLARLSPKQRSGLSEARLQFLLRRAPAEVARALEPFGWYSPSVDVRREPVRGGVRVVVTVDRGEALVLKTMDADIDGAARDDRFVMRELPKLRPRVGERFVHSAYEAGKLRVERKLAERGYFQAQRKEGRVEVRRAAKSAEVRLRWASGPRHAMGEARFGANAFRPGLLEPLVDWAPGDSFHRNRLLRLQRRMAQLDYFALIDVVPLEDEAGADLRVPIEITTTPAKRTTYTAAVSVGTDTGLGLRGGLNRRWVNDRGHKWLADAEWSQRRSGLSTQYRIPSLRALPGWWSSELATLEEDPQDALGYERVSLSGGWQGQRDPWTLSGRLVFAEETTRPRQRRVDLDATQTLLYPELSATWRQIDDPLAPEEALQATAMLRGGLIEAGGNRRRFAQLELGAHWLKAIDDAQRLILRAELGTTAFGGSLESLEFPTSLRYFAGGDRSIRGYGYREVGPRFEGEVIGGLHRIVASAEYQYFFTESWGVAAFVDAGDAFNTRRGFDPKVGAGLGARWRSPVGLVGVDVAQGLDKDAGGGTRLHISFGAGF
jgi:translocation and assembly module TamA